MIVEDLLSQSKAVVSAWLPGTAGGDEIVDALVGRYSFRPKGDEDRRNTLAFDWPRSQVLMNL